MMAGCMQYTDLYCLPHNKGSMGTAAVMDSHDRWYNDCGYLYDCMSHKTFKRN